MKNPPKTAFSLILILSILFNCQETPKSNEHDDSAITEIENIDYGQDYNDEVKAIIESKNAAIVKYYALGEIDSAAVHFADNVIQMPPNQIPMRGIESFKQGWKQSSSFGKWDFTLKVEDVKACGDLATELGSYTMKFTPNENSPIPAIDDKGSYVVLWEKIDGDWKILWDAPVSELPLGGLPEGMEER